MPGGRFSGPVRRGSVVERAASSRSVHALLRHFERVGFELAPRYLGSTDDEARDMLSFIEGEAAHYPLTEEQRSDATLVAVAQAVRAMHDATQGFLPEAPEQAWQSRELSVPARIDCIGHHDLAPWNIVFDGTRVTGIIDWDFAAPSNRAWDLSYTAHRFVPLSCPRLTQAFGWETEPDRAASATTARQHLWPRNHTGRTPRPSRGAPVLDRWQHRATSPGRQSSVRRAPRRAARRRIPRGHPVHHPRAGRPAPRGLSPRVPDNSHAPGGLAGAQRPQETGTPAHRHTGS
jgi:hypothetical protein